MAERPSHRLVVILHADVVGSTALVQHDETIAHERIQDSFRRFSETIEAYSGVTHELRGDALVAEFDRASDAVSAGIAFQADNSQVNATLEDDVRPELRIGISLGEVVIADNTVTGAGVVLAQRLEQLADPGGMCIQDAAYQSVPKRLPFEYESLGEQEVKGFEEPVRAYRVALKSGMSIPSPDLRSGTRETKPVWRRAAVAVVVFLIVVGGGFAWWQPWKPEFESASVERMAFPLPDKPSIAVLPFTNMSGDPEQEYFVDGMTEDLITDLSKVAELFVIARNSTFAYKGKSPDIRQVAEELGVRYVLEGSVRRSGDQVRINAQLIDATTGGHMWADRYDGNLKDIFGLQDEVTRSIVTILAVQLTTDDKERATRKETENPQAYDAFLKGWEHYLRQRPNEFRTAISHFEKAVELDPQYARAYAALAATYWETWKRFWHKNLGLPYGSHEPRFRAEQFLAKAMQNPTPLAHQVASGMLLHMQQHEDAIAEAQRAITLDPNDADSYIALAGALSLAGRPDEALSWVERAMRLNPHYPPHYLYQLGLAQFSIKQLEKAASTLETATALNPDDRWSYRLLLATYGLLGRSEDTTRTIQAIKERDKRGWLSAMDPLTVRTSAFWLPFKNPEDAERLAQGLRNAGIPD